MYLFTLDWPLKKNYFNCNTSSALCIQHKYVYMHCSSNKFLKKTNQQSTHGSTAPDFLWIHLQTACKMLGMLCKMCSTQLEPWYQGTSGIKEKKKKKRKTNRFHVAGHLFCNWSQMTSKCGGPGPWRAMGGLALFLDMSPRTSPFFTPHSSLFSTDWDYGLPCLELHNFSLYLFIDYELWQKAKVVAPAHAVH